MLVTEKKLKFCIPFLDRVLLLFFVYLPCHKMLIYHYSNETLPLTVWRLNNLFMTIWLAQVQAGDRRWACYTLLRRPGALLVYLLQSPGNFTERKVIFQGINLRYTSPGSTVFCFVSCYRLLLEFQNCLCLDLDVNTENEKQLFLTGNYRDFLEQHPREI